MDLARTLHQIPDGYGEIFETRWPLRVADVDADGHLRLDAAARHIQDAAQDHARAWGADQLHPLWIIRRTIIDVMSPITFQSDLRLRRWCSGTSTRWCQMRVRIDGNDGGRIESEGFWINMNRDTMMPSIIGEEFLSRLNSTTDTHRLRWKPILEPLGERDTADATFDFPVRATDIDIFNHVNNSVYWAVVEEYLRGQPRRESPFRVVVEHIAPVAPGDKVEVLVHTGPSGHSVGAATTLTYMVGTTPKAVAVITDIPAAAD
ncbi:acyl-[acyl-carrier-protein] thioesterase [Mycobacterium colombiense]|uniref:Acyl-ACP thioesterase n=1 Tax=Mycobacterium colombiense TaxID=339268 RepID=A0A1A2YR35_9MYCO|nr:acyl-[acyl-carrier-protein] thioesterase [Mycobacterium colombiense]OBI39702.1 acyl-ACP thioesterase [Mycobacterium colombiense]